MEQEAHLLHWRESAHQIARLEVGVHALLERIHLVRHAKNSIDVQYYLFHDDEVGKLFAYELIKAAARGVKVRIIVDQMLFALNHEHIAAVLNAHPNFELKMYNPVSKALTPSTLDMIAVGLFEFNRINQRMHNKLLLIDEEVAVCGGRNIGNEYYDLQKGLNFRDRDIVIRGAVCHDLKQSFETYWQHPICVDIKHVAGMQRHLKQNTAVPALEEVGIAILQKQLDELAQRINYKQLRMSFFQTVGAVAAWSDQPGKFIEDSNTLHMGHSLAALQMQAQDELIFQSPYLILSDRSIHVFRSLRKKGCSVRISTNSLAATDSWPTYAYLHRQKKLLLSDLQLHISEFKPFPQ